MFMVESQSMLSALLAFYFNTISDAETLPVVNVLFGIYAQLPEISVILVKLQFS